MKPRTISLQDCEAILIDVGGTLRIGKTPIDGAADFLKILRRKKVDHYLLSNTTAVSSATFLSELNSTGLHIEADQLMTANLAAIHYLKTEGINTAYVIGTEDQKQEFHDNGIRVLDHVPSGKHVSQQTALLLSLDLRMDYATLTDAARLLEAGATYIATNADMKYMSEDGLVPDTGAVIAFLKAVTGREPVVTGKPSEVMINSALEKIGVPANRIAIIGDQMEVDMYVAQHYGMVSVLVLSGVQRREDLKQFEYQPDYIVDSIANLTPLFA